MATSISPEEAYALLVAKRIGTSKTRVLNIFRLALHEASLIASQVDFDDEKPFTFDGYPLTKGRSDKLIRDLSQKILSEVQSSVSYAWGLSERKYDELEKSIKGKVSSFHQERALQAFLDRRDGGLGLSDRVWRVTEQAKQEIEMALDLGLRKGQDAASLARTLQESLNEPSLLFRRVRDEHGELHLSSRAKAYHPGRGVYRSSYKNALRLTATETNIAYRTADYLRVQELDFVRGIRVNLSKNHTLNGKPFHCICDEFAGDYPKNFKFTGWHPLCRCYTTTILSEDPDAPEDTPLVTEVPQGLRDWLDDNKDRVERIFQKGNPAYWLRDNAEKLGLSRDGTAKKTPSALDRAKARHEARSASEVEDIKKRWEDRKRDRSKLSQVVENAKTTNIEALATRKRKKLLTEEQIVLRLSGGDLTDGSCSSLALAYAGNKHRWDVLDYRGGKSCDFFSRGITVFDDIILKAGGVVTRQENDFEGARALFHQVKEGKEYYFACGAHAAIIRKKAGKIEYLELQSGIASENGFHELSETILRIRFGAKRSRKSGGVRRLARTGMIDIDQLGMDNRFGEMLGYINTKPINQRKGKRGGKK